MLFISAKTGQGVDTVLDSIINRIDPPVTPKKDDPLRCFLFDARYVLILPLVCSRYGQSWNEAALFEEGFE